ncbi:MAG: hypothetical protein ACI3ZR_04170 [bacterium]
MRLIDQAWEIINDPQVCKADIINDHCPYEYGLEKEEDSFECESFGSCRNCWFREQPEK